MIPRMWNVILLLDKFPRHHNINRILITQTLDISNLALTRTKFDFPQISAIQ